MSKYIPADMVTINYGVSPEVWGRLQKTYQDHLDNHPMCETCKTRNSVRITPLGPIKAICLECLDDKIQEMQEEYEILRAMDEDF